MTDPIADMLARIRNAVAAKHSRVDVPASRLKLEIARILKEEGYINNFVLRAKARTPDSDFSALCARGTSSITTCSAYRDGRGCTSFEKIPRSWAFGINIVSTSRGSGKNARKKYGGEVLAEGINRYVTLGKTHRYRFRRVSRSRSRIVNWK